MVKVDKMTTGMKNTEEQCCTSNNFVELWIEYQNQINILFLRLSIS